MKKLKPVNFPRLNSALSEKDRAKLVNALARNIQTVFSQATDAEIIDGISWYAKARGFAYTLAQRFDKSVAVTSATIAALSPNCGWSRNQTDALTVLLAYADGKKPEDIKVSTYAANKRKAFSILASNDTSVLGGLKTTAFADNTAKAESCAVTIDFHACSVARGIRFTTANAKPITAPQYQLLTDAYRVASQRLNLRPYELQAIVWCTWRRIQDVGAHHG